MFLDVSKKYDQTHQRFEYFNVPITKDVSA